MVSVVKPLGWLAAHLFQQHIKWAYSVWGGVGGACVHACIQSDWFGCQTNQ